MNIKQLISIVLLATTTLTLHAQVMEVEKRAKAERAAEEAKKAAEAAAAARRDAAEGMKPILSDEATRLAQQQEQQKQAQQQTRLQKLMADSVKWAENQHKLQNWKRKWFVGGQLSVNMALADNITDHPPFKYGQTFGMGIDAFAGRHLSRQFALRAGVSQQTVKNRMDQEWVNAWQHHHLYKGKGFFRFSLTEIYADALFDISGVSYTNRFYPLHAYALIGTGVLISGKKKMDLRSRLTGDAATLPDHSGHSAQEAYNMYDHTTADGKHGYSHFEDLTKTKTSVSPILRLGLLFDYRFSQALSLSIEPVVTFANDRMEGIKYDEPFDMLLKLKAGLTYNF